MSEESPVFKKKEKEEATRDGWMGLFQMMMDNLIEWI